MEAKSPKSKDQQGHIASEGAREESYTASP